MDATTSAIVKLLQGNLNSQNLATTTQWVNIGVLVITAIILAITAKFIYDYTQATLDLRDAARDEIALSMLPLLVFEFDKDGDNYIMKVRNMGKGPALNLNITPFELESEGKKFKSVFRLPQYNLLDPDNSESLRETVYINNQEEKGSSLIPHLHPHFATNNYEIKITFNNSLGASYQTIIKTGKDGISVIQLPKRQRALKN